MRLGRSNGASVAVTAAGMVSSLGPDIGSSCAAARAGLSRVSPLEEAAVYDEDSGELVAVAGHCVLGTEGFVGVGRTIRLAEMAMKDLILHSGGSLPGLEDSTLFFALPGWYSWCESTRRELEPVADSLPFDAASAIAEENQKRKDEYEHHLIPRLSRCLRLSLDEKRASIYFGEQAGFARALKEAVSAIRTGRATSCLVGGVDSLVDPTILPALFKLGLLKTAVAPTGFMPGEAAGIVRLETVEQAVRRGAEILAFIDEPRMHDDPAQYFSDLPSGGRALATALSESAGPYLANGSSPGLLVGNLNGDTRLATEWGRALTRLPAPVRAAPMWSPAESFGEVGAASGAVATCVGLRALQRGYSETSVILIWLSGDDGAKSSFVLRRPESTEETYA